MLLIGILIVTIAFLWGSVGFLIGRAAGYGEGLKDGVGIRGYFVEKPTSYPCGIDLTPFEKEKDDTARKEDPGKKREEKEGLQL